MVDATGVDGLDEEDAARGALLAKRRRRAHLAAGLVLLALVLVVVAGAVQTVQLDRCAARQSSAPQRC